VATEKKREKKVSKAFLQKQKTVAEIQKNMTNAKSIVFVDYKTLTVAEATALRVKCRADNVIYKVYKNNLVRIALNNMGIRDLDAHLTGTLGVVFSNNDEVTGAKIIAGQKFKNKMALKFGLIGNSVLDERAVTRLRDLPSKEQLIAQIMGLIQSGARNIASVVQAVPRNLALVLDARAKQSA